MTQSLEFLVFREKKVYSHSSNFGFKMVLTWVMVIFETCDYLHLSIYPEGQIEYPVELVNFLERALLLLPDVTKKPCGLFLDYTQRHTDTHTCISHIHTHECHTHYTDTCKHVTHKHVTRMHTCHTHIMSWKYTWTHMYLSIWAQASWYVLPSPAAFLGGLHTVECYQASMTEAQLLMNVTEVLSQTFTILPIVKCASWALRVFTWLCDQQQHPALSAFHLGELKRCPQ